MSVGGIIFIGFLILFYLGFHYALYRFFKAAGHEKVQ